MTWLVLLVQFYNLEVSLDDFFLSFFLETNLDMSKLIQAGLRCNPRSIRRMGHSASNPAPGEKWVIDDTPTFTLKGMSMLVGVLGLGFSLRELRKDDNNFISAFINRKMNEQCEKGWNDHIEILECHHQAMLEHIERKKFVRYPMLPTYKSMFHYPTYNFHEKRLPGSMDD